MAKRARVVFAVALFAVVFVAARMTTAEVTSRGEDSVVATEMIGGTKTSTKVGNRAMREIEGRRGRDVGRPRTYVGNAEIEEDRNGEVDETPLWVLGGVGGDEDAMGRRRLSVNFAGCVMNSTTCSCSSGVLNAAYAGLSGIIPTELGLCADLTQVYVYKISFVATCRRDVHSFFVLSSETMGVRYAR